MVRCMEWLSASGYVIPKILSHDHGTIVMSYLEGTVLSQIKDPLSHDVLERRIGRAAGALSRDLSKIPNMYAREQSMEWHWTNFHSVTSQDLNRERCGIPPSWNTTPCMFTTTNMSQ